MTPLCSIKRPGLNFSPQSLLNDLVYVSQVLRASVHESQGNLVSFEKVSIKRSVSISISNPRNLKQLGLTIETIE